MAVAVGAASDQGRVRKNNEDSFVVLVPPQLPEGLDAVLVVADGMGGHQAGEVASQIVISRFKRWFNSDTGPRQIDHDVDLRALLARVIVEANDEILADSVKRPQLHGMGTTVIAVAIVGDRLYLGSVGDSRAYLIEASNVYQLNHDHSWVADQVRAGRMTKDEAERHPRRNVLTRAVGVVAGVKVDTQTFELGSGDAILMCSDGLTNMVSESELLGTVRAYDQPARAANELVRLANERGSPDNVTVVIARYSQTAPMPVPDSDAITLPGTPSIRRR